MPTLYLFKIHKFLEFHQCYYIIKRALIGGFFPKTFPLALISCVPI